MSQDNYRIQNTVPCDLCNGVGVSISGFFLNAIMCPLCEGRGYLTVDAPTPFKKIESPSDSELGQRLIELEARIRALEIKLGENPDGK